MGIGMGVTMGMGMGIRMGIRLGIRMGIRMGMGMGMGPRGGLGLGYIPDEAGVDHGAAQGMETIGGGHRVPLQPRWREAPS